MAHKDFTKEDFVKTEEGNYQLEYSKSEIGEGSNIIIEEKSSDGTYSVIQIPIKRHNESIFIVTDHPIEGRLILD
nr:glutathione synthase [uncultured Chryseobacterium sp.]